MQHKDRILLEDAFYANLYQQTPSREDSEDIILDVFLTALLHATFNEQKNRSPGSGPSRTTKLSTASRSIRQRHLTRLYYLLIPRLLPIIYNVVLA